MYSPEFTRNPGREAFHLLLQQALLKQLLLEPERHRHLERAEATGRIGEVGLDQPLELQEGFVIEHDVIDFVQAAPRLGQAIVDGPAGKAGIVLLTGEALFLRRRDDAAVIEQRGRAVVIERRNAENPHGRAARTRYR